jgi:spore germination protein GerM
MSHPRIGSVAIAIMALVLASCGVPIQGSAHVDSDRNVPSGLLDANPPTTTSTTSAAATSGVMICLTQPSGPLRSVVRQLQPDRSLTTILDELTKAPPAAQLAEGLGTTVPAGVTAVVKGGLAEVTLNADFATISAHDQLSAVAQTVCTLTDQPGIGQVQFRLNGVTADVPRGDGSTSSAPVSRDDYPQLMPPLGA